MANTSWGDWASTEADLPELQSSGDLKNTEPSKILLSNESFKFNATTQQDIGTAETIVMLILIILYTSCNILALYIIFSKPRKDLSLKFVIALCLKDILLGVTIQVMIVMQLYYEPMDETCNLVLAVLFTNYILLSSWFPTLISVDRYVAINKPLCYVKWFNNRTFYVLIFLTCVTAAGISCIQIKTHSYNVIYALESEVSLPYAEWTYYAVAVIALGLLIPLSINCFAYGSIHAASKCTTELHVARQHTIEPQLLSNEHGILDASEKITRKTSITFLSVDVADKNGKFLPVTKQSIAIDKCEANSIHRSVQLPVYKDNRKAAKMGALVVTEQILVWLPFYTVLLLRSLGYIRTTDYNCIAIMWVFVDGIANLFIYVLIRKSSKLLLLRRFGLMERKLHLPHTNSAQSITLRSIPSFCNQILFLDHI